MRSDIHIFNPTCELAVANGTTSWRPNRILQKFERDLAQLPLYYAQPKDYIIVPEFPSDLFLNELRTLKKEIPQFENFEKLKRKYERGELQPGKIKPWGWSQVVHHKFDYLKQGLSESFKQGPVSNWNKDFPYFVSRQFAALVLEKFIQKNPDISYCHEECIPVVCRSEEQVLSNHKRLGKSMVKAPWSSSGRGVQAISSKEIHPSVMNLIRGIIKNQGFVTIEPLLIKKLDFATHYKLKHGEITCLGNKIFAATPAGKYSSSFLKGYFLPGMEEYKNFLHQKLQNITGTLMEILKHEKLTEIYEGVFGIDGMIYLDEERLKIQPCLEINLRYTMGYLSCRLEDLIAENSCGVFKIFKGKNGEFKEFIKNMHLKKKPHISNGKVVDGIVALVDQKENQSFGAYMEIVEKISK